MEFSFLDALSTTLVAMTIVFSLLIILQYIIRIQSFLLNFGAKKEKAHKVDIIEKEYEDEVEAELQDGVETELQDDLEIVAVIAASLAAYLDIPESNLRIKSIKRVNNNSGWGISAIGNNLKT